jgi:hypothetical protein
LQEKLNKFTFIKCVFILIKLFSILPREKVFPMDGVHWIGIAQLEGPQQAIRQLVFVPFLETKGKCESDRDYELIG